MCKIIIATAFCSFKCTSNEGIATSSAKAMAIAFRAGGIFLYISVNYSF